MADSIYTFDPVAANNSTLDSIPYGPNQLYHNQIDNWFRSLAAKLAQFVDDLGAVNTVTGTDTIAVTLASGITTYATGQVFRFVAANTNTGAATMNVNGIGAKAIRKISGGTDVALVAGDIAAGVTYEVMYRASANSAAGAWVIVSASVATATTSQAGIVELATDAEAIALTDTARAITPSNLSAVLTNARWETVPNGIVALASGSAVAAIDITGLSAYRRLRIAGHLFPSTDSVSIYLRTSEDNGTSFAAGASDYDYQYIGAQSTTIAGTTATVAQFPIFTTGVGNQSDEGVSVDIDLGEFNQTRYAQAIIHTGNTRGDGTLSWQAFYARRRSTTARNAIRFVASSGNIYGHLIIEGLRG